MGMQDRDYYRRHRKQGTQAGGSWLLLIAVGLVLVLAFAAIAKSRGWFSPKIPNAAPPTSQLPGAVAQAQRQATEWGPGGGPPVVIPDDTNSIKLLPPKQSNGRTTFTAQVENPIRAVPRATPDTSGVANDRVPFNLPVSGTMTPCGNDTAKTALFYQDHVEVKYRKGFLRWECRYLPTGSRAESLHEIDCESKTVAQSSTVYFRGLTRLTEVISGEQMHPPTPNSTEEALLTLACTLPQPSPEELGRRPVSPDVLLPTVDACFAKEVARLPARPSNAPPSRVSDEAAMSFVRTCKEAQQWVYGCMFAGTPERDCMAAITERARLAIGNRP